MNLDISHNLFLTREERYKWHSGESLKVVGVSVPVWYSSTKNSDPIIEVFCEYQLNVGNKIFIRNNRHGYEIAMPITAEYNVLPDEIWQSLTPEERELWYEKNEPLPCLVNLLDFDDGGAEWLAFRQYNKINRQNDELNIAHFAEIKDIKFLNGSLV